MFVTHRSRRANHDKAANQPDQTLRTPARHETAFDAALGPTRITSFSKRASPSVQMSALARTSAASRESSPVPQPSSPNAANDAYMKSERKKLTGKLFRLDTPKGGKPPAATPRVNGGEAGTCDCRMRGQRALGETLCLNARDNAATGGGTLADRGVPADNSFRIPSMVFDDSTDPNVDILAPGSRASVALPGSVRRVSGSLDVAAAEMSRAGTLSPPNENQWSSAVGHATTNGKSGRVIERLMAENDRLKRELELQLLRSQELERNLQAMRPQIEALRTENDNLNHANSMDGAILARRDRKIEQLKEEVATERSRREASDLLARRLERQAEDVQDTARRDVQLAHEEAKHSTTHASILEQSHRQLSSEYRQRAERWRKDLGEMQAQRQADAEKFSRLDVVGEQMRTELERSRKMQVEFVEKWDEYTKANEDWKAGVEGVADFENNRMRKLSEDMETVTNRMKWVMGLEKSRTEKV